MKLLKDLIVTLQKKHLTLALAESVTAGYASYLLTKISGSSKVFKGGVVVYSLDSKNKLFKIPASLLKKTQGVSKEVAVSLAKKVRQKFKADIGAAIVGFAWPGAKKGLKVGTIFIAYTARNKVLPKKMIIKGNRDTIRKKAAQSLLNFLYKNIKK